HTSLALGLAILFLFLPQNSWAWGRTAHRLIILKAVDTLPGDVRAFFEAGRGSLLQHVTDPLDALAKNPADRRNAFIALDKYGRFPFEALPRGYKAAVTKFGRIKLEANGLLPWQIGVYSEKLTNAFKLGKWEEAKLDAAILAHYVAQAHDPFSTTDYYDRFYNEAGAILIRQLSDAATDVGSFWLTAWTNAGRPSLPH